MIETEPDEDRATGSADGDAAKGPSFEEMMDHLETVVDELEGGKLTLDKAFEKYKKGMELLKNCSRTIEAMEQRIEILEKEGAAPRPFESEGDVDAREG